MMHPIQRDWPLCGAIHRFLYQGERFTALCTMPRGHEESEKTSSHFDELQGRRWTIDAGPRKR